MSETLSHRGICVSDLAASRRFYIEGLGFEEESDDGIIDTPDLARATGIPGASARITMLRHPDGIRLQLLHFRHPLAFGSRERRPTNQYGLVHMCFSVDDVNDKAEQLRQAGGAIITKTRTHYAANDVTMLYCTDPDGVRIEIQHIPQVPLRFSHSCTCVKSIEDSIPYYRALGFEPTENYVLTEGFEWLATFNETPGIKLRAQLICDAAGNSIELFQVYEPGSFGPREPRAFNQLGFTHMAWLTDDLEEARRRLAAVGGRWIDHAPTRAGKFDVLQGADPDGVRIELLQLHGG